MGLLSFCFFPCPRSSAAQSLKFLTFGKCAAAYVVSRNLFTWVKKYGLCVQGAGKIMCFVHLTFGVGLKMASVESSGTGHRETYPCRMGGVRAGAVARWYSRWMCVGRARRGSEGVETSKFLELAWGN